MGHRRPFGGPRRLDLLNEGPQLRLDVRVLFQQVRPPPRPPPRQRRPDQFGIRPGLVGELLARLRQPQLDQLSPLGVTAPQQLGILVLGRFPPVGTSGICHHLAGERC